MIITVGIEPTICAPKTARLPTAIIVIIISVANIHLFHHPTNKTHKKFSFLHAIIPLRVSDGSVLSLLCYFANSHLCSI